MANSTLHLTVDKGPKQGGTIARKAGTLINIGRVVKGNNFPIKDPGISQNHLKIEFDSDISRWFVKDLDTSNGTIVNGHDIPSSTPFPLSDGDSIKIGESTTMAVKIEVDGEIDGGLRRGRSRAARSRTESSVSFAEVKDVEVEEPENLGRGRPRKGKSSRVSKKDDVLEVAVEDSVEVRPRRAGFRTRAAAASRISKEEGPGKSNVEADSLKASQKDEVLNSVVEDSIEAPKNVKRGRAKKAPARTRASSAKAVQAEELSQCDSLAEEVGANAAQAEELRQCASLAEAVGDEEEANVESDAAVEGKVVETREEDKCETDEEETDVDFENMTLGQWFDSMEKYLPQAINKVAEQMIASLRKQAEQFDEYITNDAKNG